MNSWSAAIGLATAAYLGGVVTGPRGRPHLHLWSWLAVAAATDWAVVELLTLLRAPRPSSVWGASVSHLGCSSSSLVCAVYLAAELW